MACSPENDGPAAAEAGDLSQEEGPAPAKAGVSPVFRHRCMVSWRQRGFGGKAMAEATIQSVEVPDPYSMDLRHIDVSRPEIMQQNAQFDYFARLRAEAPVHYCENGMFGPFSQ